MNAMDVKPQAEQRGTDPPAPTYYMFNQEDAMPGSKNWDAWEAWFARNGVIDVQQIPIHGWIVRNVDEHQLVVLEMWRKPGDVDNREHPNTFFYRDSEKGILLRARVVQLDREPEPFPVPVTAGHHYYEDGRATTDEADG